MKAERKRTSVSQALAAHRGEHLGAVEARHADVEHRDLGAQAPDLLERLAPVARLADQLEVGAVLDRAHDPLAVDRMVVGDQHGHAFLLALTAEASLVSADAASSPGPGLVGRGPRQAERRARR